MAENTNQFDVFDPTGILKTMRNDSLEAWSKAMVQFVNTSAYADATGKMLDVWLSNSEPFRKQMENVMSHALANLSMPSRDEVTRLAERLTNIELRLDDMDAKLDQLLQALQTRSATT